MTDGTRRTFYPIVDYRDPVKAMDWLERAFGFEKHEVARNEDGDIVHIEMRYDTGILMISETGKGASESAGNAGMYVAVDDPDAHHDRAKAAGAEIIRELTDQPYGSREYGARDLEGNAWHFGTYRP
ncbi:VOC family protein [Spirillospora sp. NPDC029432]|uniref:VOC family protein n=1 Tax=Spirillospora sp. NPDC029432 TaxID=3154599 RepID=UPI0034544BF0